MSDSGTTPRHIRISDERWDALEVAAKIGGTTRAAIVNELLRWYLEDYGPTPPMPTVPHLPVPPKLATE